MKLLLVDDHALVREGLALLIEQAWPAALEMLHAGSLQEALQQMAAHPDVRLVLLDLGLPDTEGLQALQALRALPTPPRVLVVSAEEDPATVLAAIDAGAAGFLPKSRQASLMLAALRTVFVGGVPLPAGVTAAPQAATAVALTPRQTEVLRLLIEGRSNRDIGLELGMAPSTVKTHLAAVFERLGVNSRTQAVVTAARLGLRLGGLAWQAGPRG